MVMASSKSTKTPTTYITCPHCRYRWKPRVKKPKACPRCKQYI